MNGTQEGGAESRVMADLSSVVTDYSDGSLLKTGNPLDIAISGKGFLSIEGGLYTRRGDFRVDTKGYIVTEGGQKVLGNGKPIQIPAGKVEVNSSGEISVNGIPSGKFDVVNFPDTSVLQKTEGGFFKTAVQGQPVNADVRQGCLESSNVGVVREMVNMINTMRSFETYEKAMHAFDDATAKVTSEMEKI
jgi:flagellar basal-body rod protein FlgG